MKFDVTSSYANNIEGLNYGLISLFVKTEERQGEFLRAAETRKFFTFDKKYIRAYPISEYSASYEFEVAGKNEKNFFFMREKVKRGQTCKEPCGRRVVADDAAQTPRKWLGLQ